MGGPNDVRFYERTKLDACKKADGRKKLLQQAEFAPPEKRHQQEHYDKNVDDIHGGNSIILLPVAAVLLNVVPMLRQISVQLTHLALVDAFMKRGRICGFQRDM